MKRINSVIALGASVLLLALGQVHAYTHPCIPATTQDLDFIKANLNQEPWKTGNVQLLPTWTAADTIAVKAFGNVLMPASNRKTAKGIVPRFHAD